jgi:hypothetical protein
MNAIVCHPVIGYQSSFGISVNPFSEIDRYFFSGCACAYFQIAVDVYTDLRYNADEWE